MFWTRLASGIVLVVVAVLTIMAGGDIWFLLVSLLSLIGLYELYKTMNIEKTMLGYAGMLAAAFYCILLRWGIQSSSIVALIAGFLLISAIYVFTFPKFIMLEFTLYVSQKYLLHSLSVEYQGQCVV